MVYFLLKPFVRLALKIFCAEISIPNRRALTAKGPLLVTANHPNSFLDAIIIGAHFSRPLHFLARGDAFKKPWHNTLLKQLNMIPIYRLSEGKENLHLNEKTFQRSNEILSEGGIVLIFIEGLCRHEYGLRSFKKGAARIALNCMRENIPLKILPMAINYSAFRKIGFEVEIHAGKLMNPEEVFTAKDTAGNLNSFNVAVQKALEPLVWKQVPARRTKKNYAMILFALTGYFLNAPFYFSWKNFVSSKTKDTVFYHSILFGVLLFTYPIYLLLIYAGFVFAGADIFSALSIFAAFPLLGYAAVKWGRD